jgi:hypothetical protein
MSAPVDAELETDLTGGNNSFWMVRGGGPDVDT